jgi:hypothetical protein
VQTGGFTQLCVCVCVRVCVHVHPRGERGRTLVGTTVSCTIEIASWGRDG